MSHKNPQQVTVATENFITLSYGLVLPRSFILSPVNHQLMSHDWPARDQQLAQSTRLDCWWRVRLC